MKNCTQCGERKPFEMFHRKAESSDGRRAMCKSCIAEKTREYRELNPETVAASKKRWSRLNPEKTLEYAKAYRERRGARGSGKAYTADVRDRNPDLYARLMAKWAKRRADRARATPRWFEAEKVIAIYRQAGRMRKAGHDVHVDHIYPLRGSTVCGLHVHTNLRIIGASENLAKGATMPAESICNPEIVCVVSAAKN